MDPWPPLPLAEWSDTHETLHMWLQIVGKIRLRLTPWTNHGWHVTLYVTPKGLTTSSIYDGTRAFEIAFDFINHRLTMESSDGRSGGFALAPMTVAAFYKRIMEELARLGFSVSINRKVNEVEPEIFLDKDEAHASYDPDYANRYWRILLQCDRVFKQFRAKFVGKCSPVHLFWGAPDLAVTRFSGRRAPEHPGGIPHLPDWVTREAYSHEVSSAGFWAGGGPVGYATFYSYAYPEPAGFRDARIKPDSAFYNTDLREFLLPYDAVRESSDPDKTLLDFLQSTYEAAAERGAWDRQSLER